MNWQVWEIHVGDREHGRVLRGDVREFRFPLQLGRGWAISLSFGAMKFHIWLYLIQPVTIYFYIFFAFLNTSLFSLKGL